MRVNYIISGGTTSLCGINGRYAIARLMSRVKVALDKEVLSMEHEGLVPENTFVSVTFDKKAQYDDIAIEPDHFHKRAFYKLLETAANAYDETQKES